MRAGSLMTLVSLVASVAAFAACSATPGQAFTSTNDSNGDADAGHHSSGGGGGGTGGGGGVLLPDGGILLPDGGVISPGGDAGPILDGGAPSSRIACAGNYCRGDQTCNAGSCQFACVGTQVPGDYASIQAAINANVGVTDLTICLKAQNYPETVSSTSAPATPKNLTIIGVSSSVSTITSLTLEYSAFSNVAIHGVGFTGGVVLEYLTKPVQFVGSKIASTSGYGLSAYGVADVLLDGCDVSSATNAYAVNFVAETATTYAPNTQKITVQNSYIHDSGTGIEIQVGGYNSGTTPTVLANIVNDTFNNNSSGIVTTGSVYPVTVTYANNLIVNSKSYGIDQEATTETVVTKNNALFGNANNYAGSAVDGPGYVKADVKLDSTQNPPGLSNGSPARGAANEAMAPATDFWGVARSSSPDIGAVQN